MQKTIRANTLVTSLNIRSLPKHHAHLLHDSKIRGRVIGLQETWCSKEHDNDHLKLPGYFLHLVSQGRGKGVATYHTKEFSISGEVNTDKYQISKVSCNEFDVLNVYRSLGANKADFFRDLKKLAPGQRTCVIVGDFNMDFSKEPQERLLKEISALGFEQLVKSPTHIEGGIIDHVYARHLDQEIEMHMNWPFYSDHAAISIVKYHSQNL